MKETGKKRMEKENLSFSKKKERKRKIRVWEEKEKKNLIIK